MFDGLIKLLHFEDTILKSRVLFLLIVFVIFLILMEFFCWFWKINKTLALMEEQNNSFLELVETQKILIELVTKIIPNEQKQNEQKKESEPVEPKGGIMDKADRIRQGMVSAPITSTKGEGEAATL